MPEEIWPDRNWPKRWEKIFVDSVIEEMNKLLDVVPRNFREESWNHICQQFNEFFNCTFDVTELKRHLAVLKKRYENVKPLYDETGFGWDYRHKMVDIDDSICAEIIEVKPEVQPYRKYECPLYDQLEFIFRSDIATGENAQGAGEVNIQRSGGKTAESNRSNKRPPSEAQAPGSGPNKKSRAEAEEVQIKPVAHSAAPQTADLYSAGSCISVINAMQGVDPQLYIAAIDLFENPCWRETFISLKYEQRLNWLKAMLPMT